MGQGAGRFPTANSVVSDLVRCAAGSCRGAGGLARAGAEAVVFDPDYEAAFFMRVTFKNQCGIVKDLGAACEKNGVSIFRSTHTHTRRIRLQILLLLILALQGLPASGFL